MSNRLVSEHIQKWAEELIDLSGRNRLLAFRHTQSASLEFSQDPATVEGRLDRGWSFFLPPAPPKDEDEPYEAGEPAADELVVSMQPARYDPQISRGLKNLAKKAQDEFLDAGLWVLYVGLGMLHWTDVDGKEKASPLLLLPVRLEAVGAGKRWRLSSSDDGEPALNPALAVKLDTDFDIRLPTLEDLEEVTSTEVMRAVERAVTGSPWKVEPRAVLTTFTFHKEVIFRDLMENQDEIAEHPTVQLLAEGPASDAALELDFHRVPDEELDAKHPPEELACVMDADATQRQCLIAARAGQSFVMDGPPGSGKSQTITNVIAQLLKDGKTLLFVSEKAAALEVVQNRLRELKLDPFVLALHSHNATRKAVAKELGQALDERPRARERFDDTARARLRSARERLSAYAVAANVVRQPLGRSLHDVVGRISGLAEQPGIPIPEVETASLTADGFASLIEDGAQLGRAWGPVTRGEDFVWRDMATTTAGAGREAQLRHLVRDTEQSLAAVRGESENVIDELRLSIDLNPGSIPRLIELLILVAARPDVPIGWLVLDDAAEPEDAASHLLSGLRERTSLEADLRERSDRWRDLHPNGSSTIEGASEDLRQMNPSPGDLDGWNLHTVENAHSTVQAALDKVRLLRQSLDPLAQAFGVQHGLDYDLAERLAGLGELVGSPSLPEPAWLNPTAKAAVDEARILLSELLTTYRARRDALANVFKESVLELDLQGLQARFAEVHKGIRKLGAAYRADKRTVASATASGKFTKDAWVHLDEAREWQRLAEQLSQAESRHASRLGVHYWASHDDADLDEIERAVKVADEALALAAGEISPQDLAAQLGLEAQPDSRIPDWTKDVRTRLHELELLPVDEVLGLSRSLMQELTFDELDAWMTGVLASLDTVRNELTVVDALAPEVTIGAAVKLLDDRVRCIEVADDIERLSAKLESFLGAELAGEDPERIETAVSWISSVRALFHGAVPERTARPLVTTALQPAPLRERLDQFLQSRDRLLDEFRGQHRRGLLADLQVDFHSAEELLEHLTATVADVTEWESHCTACGSLSAAGWAPVLDACEQGRLPSDAVAPTIERVILQRWADQVIDGDSALRPKRAVDRDQLLEEFRQLDADLVADAAARVINRCVERRPASLTGQAGIIRQQAELKRRHKPVRQLLTEAGEAAQRLKPCFMMSPLSVSQFLPPGLRFDVVIFDEASQVREADAIGCIYRGDQLIVAGDPKQLPPTNFFQRSTDQDEEKVDTELLDFESVLDRSKAQGVPSLPLNWHYRSRHESLITFSNRSFYDGRLHTFPSAQFESPDLGVQLFRVDGIYDRGGTRTNEVEADAVVDRIIFHRRHHPELTMGVVTLSSAQQSAIEYAIERRADAEPELASLISDDRLDGFFVKNLENVQGDERDLIILSIGYGPDENGKFTMNFGPMSSPGGERRLNVAVTRARMRVEVVCSFRPGEIRTDNPVTKHLARYLDYAGRGIAALAIDLTDSEGDAESPFEEEVLRTVRSLGYDAGPQVGVAGYRIDIGIRHPAEPGRYILGVECDGASYHSSKVARDRDRLREQVLRGLGWQMHRIWSTAWFADRAGETERLRQAIERAQRGEQSRTDWTRTTEVHVEVDEHDFDELPDWLDSFEPPVLPLVRPISDFTDPSNRSRIAGQIAQIVAAAGPLHRDQVLEAVRHAWSIGRAGARIRDAFDAALSSAVARGDISQRRNFLHHTDDFVAVRGPGVDGSTRPVGHVAPDELDLAVVRLLADAGTSAACSDLRTAWARLFGWRRIGTEIENAFDDALDRLRSDAAITGTSEIKLTARG